METSSLHGLVHIVTQGRTRAERVVWTAFVVLAAAGCLTIALNMLGRYDQNPTVISLERDYLSWLTVLPAATVCPTAPWNSTAINEYINSDICRNVTDKEALRRFLQNLTMASYDNFHQLEPVNGNPLKPEDYQSFVYKHVMHWKKEDFLLTLKYDGKTVIQPPVETWTERGICYSVMSDVAPYNSPEYWARNSWEKIPPTGKISGHPLIGNIYLIFNTKFEDEVYTHFSGDVADCTIRGPKIPLKVIIDRLLIALEVYSTQAVRDLAPRQRRCRLPNDKPALPIAPLYTYRLCRADCRRRLAKRLSGCVPFFYRRVDDTPVCNETQMMFLAKYIDILTSLEDKENKYNVDIDCNCMPMCDEVLYARETSDIRYGGVLADTAAFRWKIETFPYVRLKRDVIFGFTDLLIAIGGTAGLFLGCSVLSFVEVAYFFTLRFFLYIVREK